VGAPDPTAERASEAASEPSKPPPELPDIATLDGSSDYRPFMQPGVPKDLRREALRKLWRANPIINSLDGLDDPYVTQDFTDGATVVADLRTAYRVGKGMLEAIEELAPAEPSPAAAEGAAAPRLETRAEEDIDSAPPRRTGTPAEPS
jgi:hypothetical protein